MKKLFLIIAVFTFSIINAQEINCKATVSELASFVEKQNYKDAEVKLKALISKCPKADESIYTNGINILKYKLETTYNDDRLLVAKELMSFYDLYDKNFPENQNGNAINKAMLMYDYDLADQNDILSSFEKAFVKDKFQFKNALALNTYFKYYIEKYNALNEPSFDDLINKFNDVIAVVNKNKSISKDSEIEFENVKISANSMIKGYLTADNLVGYAERNHIKNQTNEEWLDSTLDLLKDCCTDKPVYGKIAYNLHQVKPSSKSAFALATFNIINNNQDKALEYFNKAAELTTTTTEKAKIYYSSAFIMFGFDKKVAKDHALLAAQNDQTNGECYLLLADIYSSGISDCASTNIEKKAIYFLAEKFALKAAQVQPILKASADSLIAEYKKFQLTNKEIEQLKKSGNKVTLDCWIQETVQM
jgi:hypothetical protein